MFLLAAMAGEEGDVTLYAIWDVERHTATLEGGTTEVDPWGHVTSTASYTGGSVTIDTDQIEPGFTLARDAVKVDVTLGYYLKGWRITVNGVTTYVEDPDAIYTYVVEGDVTFEPVFGNYAEDEAARRRALGYGREREGLAQTGDPFVAPVAPTLTLLLALALLALGLLLASDHHRPILILILGQAHRRKPPAPANPQVAENRASSVCVRHAKGVC